MTHITSLPPEILGLIFKTGNLSIKDAKNLVMTCKHMADNSEHIYAGVTVRSFKAHGGSTIHSIKFSSDGKLLVSGGGDGSIKLWDTRHAILKKKMDYQSCVLVVAISNDGNLIAGGGKGGYILIHDIKSDKMYELRRDSLHWIHHITFTNDNKRIIIGYHDGVISSWNIEDEQSDKVIRGPTQPITSLAVSADGKYIAYRILDFCFAVKRLDTNTEVFRFQENDDDDDNNGLTNYNGCIKFSKDSKTVVYNSRYRIYTTEIESGNTESCTVTPNINIETKSTMFSDDLKYVAFSGYNNRNGCVHDIKQNILKRELTGNIEWILTMAFSPCGKYIAGGGLGGNIRFWKL